MILFQHLGFIHCPIREHCPFHQNCIDNLLDELLMGDKTTQTTANVTNVTTVGSGTGSGTTTTTNTTTLASINHKNHYKTSMNNWKSATISNATSSGNDKTLNLLIVGSEHLASDLLNDVRMCTGSKGEYIYENQTYYLNYRIANGDMEAFKAIDVYSSGKD